MFYSLVQTIVCVLLIQAGIYALHLNGPSANSNGASLGSGGGGGAGLGVNAPTSHGGSGAAQLNAAVNTNQMLNILSANQHAQHLHAGGSGSGSGGGGGGGGIGLSRTLSNSAVNPLGNAGRLSQELADRAQLERERLMLLGLAKQTALANSGTGHHGRPIITGRIQMSPVDDVESDYSTLLLPQTRGPLYGSVVKEPAAVEDDEYVDEEQREYDRARLASGAHRKYEYGRIVEPAEREEYAEPQPIDELDELIEAEPEMDDVLSDLESYQYLDELLPPEHRSLWGDDGLGYGIAGGNSRPHHLNDGFPLLLNPYRTLEELENSPSHTLQEIFEKESHDKAETKAHRQHASHPTREQQKQQQQYEQQQQTRHQPTQPQQQYTFSGGVKHRNGGYGGDYNTNMQQKWQRKRSQQQQQQRQLQQWQRNIFGQQLKQQQLHHFGTQPQRHSKLSLANSEATATKHIPLNGSTNDLNNNNNNNSNNKLSSALNALATQQQSSSAPIITSGVAAMKSDQLQLQQRQQQQQQQEDEPTQQQVGKISTADDASPATGLSKAAGKLKAQQQQQQQHKKQQTPSQKQDSFLHPNHKRSGSVGGVGAANGMSAAAAAAATNGYSSIASQLMLRTARGQRQYDVPQIECPTAMDGMERFACPTPDVQGRYRCIDDHVLCDGFIDCPEGEDEDRRSCMFYKTVKAHLDVLADALLRWARGR